MRTARPWTRAEWGALAAALVLGFALRALAVLPRDFPLNDGGLFDLMVLAVRHAHFALPRAVDYNGATLPFDYPPLGFYAAAALTATTPLSVLDALRWLPLLVSTATIVPAALIARRALPSRPAWGVALFVFAAVPSGYAWMVMGGGLTRSFGLLFGLFAVHALMRGFAWPTPGRGALAAVLCALSLLSHLEASSLVAGGALALLVAGPRDRPRLAWLAAVAGAAAVLAAPWWATVLARDGLSGFAHALGSGPGPLVRVVSALAEPVLNEPLVGSLALLGAVAAWWRGRRFAPTWFFLAFLLTRNAVTYGAVAAAILVAEGLCGVLLPFVGRVGRTHRGRRLALGARTWDVRWRPLLPQLVVIGAVLFVAWVEAANARRAMRAVSAPERAAMAWVGASTPASARFLVMSSGRDEGAPSDAGLDPLLEWFPALTGRMSVVTPQGREWFGAFRRTVLEYDALQRCTRSDAACIAEWSRATGETFDYVLLPRLPDGAGGARGVAAPVCCATLVASLRASPAYAVAYDGPGALILRYRPTVSGEARAPSGAGSRR